MSRIENTGQIKTGYSVKSGTNPEEKVENGSDFASMLTKYKKKAAQDDETKKQKQGKQKIKKHSQKKPKTGEMKNRLMAGSPKKTKKQMK